MLAHIKKAVSDTVTHANASRPRVERLKSTGTLALDASTGSVRALALLSLGPDDARLLGGHGDGSLRSWSTTSGVMESQAKAHDRVIGVRALATDASGTRVLSAGGTGEVVSRDGASGRILVEHVGSEGFDASVSGVRCVCTLRGGEVVAGDDAGRVFMWEADSALPSWRWATPERAGAGALSPRLGGAKGKLPAPPERINALSAWVSRTTGEEFVVSGCERGILTIWRARQVKPVAEFGENEGGHKGSIRAIVENNGVIITAGADGRVLAWYVNENGELLGPPETLDVGGHHSGPALCLATIREGLVVSGGADGRALIWDVKSRSVLFECPSTKGGAVESLLFDSAASVLFTGCARSQILRWDVPHEMLFSPRAHEDVKPMLTRNISADEFERWDDAPVPQAPVVESSESSSNGVAQELAKARELLSEVEKERDSLRKSDASHLRQITNLENALRKERASLEAAKEEIQTLKKAPVERSESSPCVKCEKMETIAHKQKAKIDHMKAELKHALDEKREKTEKVDELTSVVVKLNGELEKVSQKNENLSVAELMAAAERALLSPQPGNDESSSEILRELHSVREELQTTRQDLSTSEHMVAKLRKESSETMKRLEILQDEQKLELERVREQADNAEASFREQLIQAESRSRDLERELHDARLQLSAKEAIMDASATSSAELKTLREEDARKDELVKELQMKVTQLDGDFNRVKAFENECVKLQEQMRQMEHELADARTADSSSKANVERLQAELNQMKKKFENAVKKGKGFQQECVELKARVEQGEVATLELERQLAETRDQAERARIRYEEQLREVQIDSSKGDEELIQARAELQSAKERVRESQESRASLVEAHQTELNELKQKFEAAVRKGKRFEHEVIELKVQLAGAYDAKNTIQAETAEIAAKLRTSDDTVAELEAGLAEAHVEAERLRDELRKTESRQGIESTAIKNEAARTSEIIEKLRGELASSEYEREQLLMQVKSTEEAQRELMKLRESIQNYEAEMNTLKNTVDSAKTKFANAVTKGKGYQAETVKLREQLEEKQVELSQVVETCDKVNARAEEIASSLDEANKKVADGIRLVAAKDAEIATLTEQLKQSEERVAAIGAEKSNNDGRGEHWLEQQAMAAAEAQARDLTQENERLRQEVAAASAAAQEAWQIAASAGVRPGDSRPASEIGSPVREGFAPRARSLYQQPTYRDRGAMSMIYERHESAVPREDYERVKEHCVKLKRDLESAKQAAKEAVQQVINRLEMEVMAKVHAEAIAKAAEAECERAWAHAKDALATAREIQKQPLRPSPALSSPVESAKPQPPPGTRAAAAMERAQESHGAIIIKQEHLLSMMIALLAFFVGALFRT